MSSYLSIAPDRVLDFIFVYCDYDELFASSHVCTAWRRRTVSSVMWRRVAQADMDRARGTEYQIVASPVQKRAGLSSSFNTAHLFTVEVRTRHRLRDAVEYSGGGSSCNNSGYGYGSATSAVPSCAQSLQMYTFGGGSTSAIASSVIRAYGRDDGDLEPNPSSMCFTTVGNTAKVRRVCMRYIHPLRFTAGEAVAAAWRRANPPTTHGSDGSNNNEASLPLWENGSIVRPGVLVCDSHDPCSFCYYASTLRRPWCTVLMDQFIIDDPLLVDFIEHSHENGGDAATSIDLAFRVEELPVVCNDPRDPSHLVKPAQPVSIRIGVIEASQLEPYQRGLQQIVRGTIFYSPADDDSAAKASNDSDGFFGDDHSNNARVVDTSAQDYAWGALDAGSSSTARRRDSGGFSWSYAGGGGSRIDNSADDDANSAAAAEAEITAWLHASVQESMQPRHGASGETKSSALNTMAASKPLEFWPQALGTHTSKTARVSAADLYTSGSSAARVRYTTDDDVPDDSGNCAYVLGDTTGSFGYDTEGCCISEASSYPLGAPLQKGDIVHLQFFRDEDVIVVMRNRERLGTLVADAFSERQRWCVAVSLQNCGVRFIPPRLN